MLLGRSILALVTAHAVASAFQIPVVWDAKSTSIDTEPLEKRPFDFENPETNCKYVSQPWIFDVFQNIATDMEGVFKYAADDITFRIMGHHPFAGHYDNAMVAYANSLWRLNNCLQDRKVDAKIWGIHGGCDQAWTVMEFYFNATTNRGDFWELTSLWVARWGEDKKLHEVRTYVDAGQIIKTLMDNEIYFNSSDRVYHSDFVPGPAGLPPWMNKTGLAKEVNPEL
ncbi:hypothetical protein BP5796_13040 [Coleophoma crateriformis]|uniref:SnoaL-like domain-containing protein n=1 Tax=Coleophoma crateriformis TaxID=565419 RepID=A0A3D8Q588_9HELO|nr:hypothetical protein BP5796_13040 [Coleophoma crateriformis]